MKRLFSLGLIATMMLGGINMSRGSELKVGDDAPPFELTGSDGKVYKLSDFRDTKAVVIAWFPKAFTGG